MFQPVTSLSIRRQTLVSRKRKCASAGIKGNQDQDEDEDVEDKQVAGRTARRKTVRPETAMTTDSLLGTHRVSAQSDSNTMWQSGESPGKCGTNEPKSSKECSQPQGTEKHHHEDRFGAVWDPDGNRCYKWMIIITTAALYNIVVIILRLAFTEMREQILPSMLFNILDIGCDFVYILDIFVQSRVTYYKDGCLVTDVHEVSVRYRGLSRFKLDVLSILPLHSVFFVSQGLLNFVAIDIGFKNHNRFYIALTRLPRLLKMHTLSGFFQITDSRTNNPNVVRVMKLSLYLVLVIHWIGCLYYIISVYEGLGSTEWAYSSGNYEDNFTRKYICCIYWSMLILTTIGERPPPQTNLEHVFTGLTFVIGVFIFAAVVGNVGDVISNLHASRQEFQSRMDQIKFYLRHRNVPLPLQNRVKRWADYTWSRNQAMDEPHLLQMLPERLQMEIAIQVHLDTLKKVTIFEECEEGLLRELVLKLRPQIFSPGDYICLIGDIGREMYIINHGKIEIIVPCADTGQKKVVATLGAGNYFGEISLLKLDFGQNRRTADVRAIGYSELLRLSRKDLLTALVEYPEAKAILETQAKERMKETMVIRKTNGDEQATPPAAEKCKRKRDWLAGVVQSESFKRLMDSKGTEISELSTIIRQLRDYQAKITEKNSMQSLEKNQRLESKLQQYNARLQKANSTIEELQKALTSTTCTCGKKTRPVVTDNKVSGRYPRTSVFCDKSAKFGLKNKCASERCLERRSFKTLTNFDPNQNRTLINFDGSQNNSKSCSKAEINSTPNTHSDHTEPVRQSSGYSSDTETMATLLRVSNALRPHHHHSLTSSGSNCDPSDATEDELESDWDQTQMDNDNMFVCTSEHVVTPGESHEPVFIETIV